MRTKALAHLEMARPYTVFHAGLVAAAGAEIASHGYGLVGRVVLAALVAMCGWEAGLYAGDYFDRHLDAGSKPYRPVPSGRVSPREAFLTMVGLIAAGYLCALALGPANLGLAILTTALGIAYSAVFKARALLGNCDRGMLGVCAALFGALATSTSVQAPVLLLCLLVFFHDSASNLVGALRDVDGDRASGYRTVPVVYGIARATLIACGLAGCGILCAIALMPLLSPPPLALLLFAAAVILGAATYLVLALHAAKLQQTQALAAHKALVVERLVLMAAYIGVYVAPSVILALLAGTLALTVAAQWALRDRYERQQTRAGAIAHSLPR